MLVSEITCILTLLVAVRAASMAAPVVNLGYGQYRGTVHKIGKTTYTRFLGIRYAAPPIGQYLISRNPVKGLEADYNLNCVLLGQRRFSAPASPIVAAGIHASVQPHRCLSEATGKAANNPFRTTSTLVNRAVEATPAESEDCLFLNVFIPGQLGQKKNLPVVVWIHGGGYVSGSSVGYDGDDLIRESGNDVVVVVIQYRLGIFGFLAGQAVKDGGSLNAGLLDQQFALQWVQRHIASFGGNPEQVTIWGESAGAGSVLQHVVANAGQTTPPLFRAAITSSTFLPSQYMYNDTIPEVGYRPLSKTSLTVSFFTSCRSYTALRLHRPSKSLGELSSGCYEYFHDDRCTTATDTLACLRKVKAETLHTVGAKISSNAFYGTFLHVPVVDGTFITDRPTELLGRKQRNGEAVLSITNSFEGTTFVDQATAAKTAPENYVAQLFPGLDSEQTKAAASQYAGLGSKAFINSAIMGESIFICPTYYLMRAFDDAAFKGEFAVPPGHHGQDRVYYFPTGAKKPAFDNAGFRKALGESYLNFARFLNPGKKWDSSNKGLPQWPSWNGTNEMLFGETAKHAPNVHVVHTSTALLKRCQFWESVSVATAQ
ncbi:hypothetical protein CVT26_015059 [Gymnopilus dilepis]|uniref:Carboxylic ester hydrolase n=1 Tax=Gymnopilus dilepis TaxID=231916 RepID=A0A409W403_9AGAR|nr:hypothetical protein CVT26_015059 [Gymnopilus dilepis]